MPNEETLHNHFSENSIHLLTHNHNPLRGRYRAYFVLSKPLIDFPINFEG